MHAAGAIFLLTLRSLMRSRFLIVVLLLSLAVILVLPLVIRDDGTIAGRAQVLVRYTLTAVVFLLSVGTLGMAPGLVSGELETRRLQQVLIKPVRFGQVWFGKWAALTAVNAVVLGASFVLSDAALRWNIRPGQLSGDQADEWARRVRVSRAVLAPAPESFSPSRIEAKKEELIRNGTDLSAHDAERQALQRLRVESQVVRPGGEKTWTVPTEFQLPAGKPLTLRVQFLNSSQQRSDSEGEWVVRDASGALVLQTRIRLKTYLPQEIAVPASDKPIGGPFTITYRNVEQDAVLFHVDHGIRMLVPAGSYGMNSFRAYWLVLFRLALLAAIGVTMGSLFYTPVAVMTSFFALVLFGFSGYIGWVAETGKFNEPHEHGHAHAGEEHEEEQGSLIHLLDAPVKLIYRGANHVLAPLRELEPLDRVASGERLAWGEVGKGFGLMIVLGCGLMAWMATVLFGRRETG